MNDRHSFRFIGTAVLVLLLSACASTDDDGIYNSPGSNDIRGTVDYVDTRNRELVLTNRVVIGYDERTTVEFEGRRDYRVEDLERGDEVFVRADSSNRPFAQAITVTRSVSGSGGSSGAYDASLRGTVRYIDTRNRTIEIDRGYGGDTVVVEYDSRTTVSFDGRRYNVDNLERGDEVDVRTRGRVAEEIVVTRSASGGGSMGGSTGDYASTVRGTVRYVDGPRRTIEIEESGRVVTLQYSSSTRVDYQGQSYSPENLERGDEIEAEVRRGSGSQWIADRIYLVRNVRR